MDDLVQRGGGGQQQGGAQGRGHEFLHRLAGGAHVVQDIEGDQRGRNTAGGQVQHHRPVNVARARQFDGAAHLGEGGEQQVGTDGQIGLHAKKEDQDRRHQGPATHAGEADDQADKKSRKDKR